jgi:hypothetical protein
MFVLLTGCPQALFPFDGALMCIRRSAISHCMFFLLFDTLIAAFSTFALSTMRVLLPPSRRFALSVHMSFNDPRGFSPDLQFHCEELFEPARVLALKLTKVFFPMLLHCLHDLLMSRTTSCLSGWNTR